MRSNAQIEQALARNSSQAPLPIMFNESTNSTTLGSDRPNIPQDIGIGLGGIALIGLVGTLLWKRCRKKPEQEGLLDAEMGEVTTTNERQAIRDRAEYERMQWARTNM